MKVLAILALLFASAAPADVLPGFSIEQIAPAAGFVTSIVSDSHGTIYYTTQAGKIFRLRDTTSEERAHVDTVGEGNSGLLGMALIDDHTAVVHYTTPRQTYDVLSRIDLDLGVETLLQRFVTNLDDPEAGSSSEHHGGNLIVTLDGSVYVGIGDYGAAVTAALAGWNGGRIFKVAPDATSTQYAWGLRNPFDLVWDQAWQRIIVADNGPVGEDEIHVIDAGAYCGWPFTYGHQPNIAGAVAPDYVFEPTVAPTGMFLLDGANPLLRKGLLLGTFVTKSILYFERVERGSVSEPVAIFASEVGPIIDVTQNQAGEIYFATGKAIYRLHTPRPGDCNGDGALSLADMDALTRELADGEEPMAAAQGGLYRGSWGCDANADGMISVADKDALARMVTSRRRSVRRR